MEVYMKHIICILLILSGNAFAQDKNTEHYSSFVESSALFPFRQGTDKYSTGAIYTQTAMKPVSGKPPLNAGRIVLESIAGFGGGFVGAISLGYMGAIMAPASDSDWFSPGMVLGVLAGYPLGTATGVYLAGSYGNETGSFGNTLLGSIIGFIGGILLVWDTDSPIPFYITSVAAPVLVFNLTRKYKDGYNPSSYELGYYDNDAGLYQDAPIAVSTSVRVNIISIIF
jgi:hypothetical protein